MADGGYTVSPALVDGHAAAVDGFAARVQAAAEAGSHYDAGADFGLIGRLFASSVADATGQSARDVATLATAGRRNAEGLRQCVAGYGAAETSHARTFDGLHR
jgi:hypothetical protein